MGARCGASHRRRHTLYAQSRSGVPQALTDQGAIACADAAEVAKNADIIFLMVPDTPHVEAVLFGERASRRGCPPARSWWT